MQNEFASRDTQEQNEQSSQLEKDLIVWMAQSRPFKKRDKQFYVTVFSIAGIVCLILFLAEGAMPVILIISLIFLYYVMSTVEPDIVEYKITNKGVKVAGNLIPWQFLTKFWFSKRYDTELLIFETVKIPNRVEMVIDSKIKEDLRAILKNYLNEENVSPSNLDRAIDWFSKKLPQ